MANLGDQLASVDRSVIRITDDTTREELAEARSLCCGRGPCDCRTGRGARTSTPRVDELVERWMDG